jgi:nucleoside-diphosphate-sugar epimerase
MKWPERRELEFFLTGATGSLGHLVLEHLSREWGRRAAVLATWNRKPPLGLTSMPGVKWMPWHLERDPFPERRFNPPIPCIVLHFACTLANDINRVFRYDVGGTLRLVRSFSTCREAPGLFVFASSTAATTESGYGLGKKYLEEELSRFSREELQVRSVRIPPVEDDSGRPFQVSRDAFPEWLCVQAGMNDWIRSHARVTSGPGEERCD